MICRNQNRVELTWLPCSNVERNQVRAELALQHWELELLGVFGCTLSVSTKLGLNCDLISLSKNEISLANNYLIRSFIFILSISYCILCSAFTSLLLISMPILPCPQQLHNKFIFSLYNFWRTFKLSHRFSLLYNCHFSMQTWSSKLPFSPIWSLLEICIQNKILFAVHLCVKSEAQTQLHQHYQCIDTVTFQFLWWRLLVTLHFLYLVRKW